ncbi:hypothetical protein FRC17_008038, partial [Serendipita sp. 399]
VAAKIGPGLRPAQVDGYAHIQTPVSYGFVHSPRELVILNSTASQVVREAPAARVALRPAQALVAHPLRAPVPLRPAPDLPRLQLQSPAELLQFWFSFGDSYTQTGFSVTGTQPSSSNALGNPPYPGYTACGSYPNWVDYLAFTLNTTLVKVYNHAYGGATIDSALVTPYQSTVKCLDDQVADFLNYNAPGKQYNAGWSSANTLFSIWIGINDIGNTYWNGSGLNDTLLNRYFELIQQLYAAGARNFLFLTVPPIYRSPLMLSQATSARDQEKVVIDDYNSKLATRAAAFASSHSGVTTKVYDTTTIVNAMLNNPSSYGLQDATSYGNGPYAWCNDYHISPIVHQKIAQGIAPLIQGTFI